MGSGQRDCWLVRGAAQVMVWRRVATAVLAAVVLVVALGPTDAEAAEVSAAQLGRLQQASTYDYDVGANGAQQAVAHRNTSFRHAEARPSDATPTTWRAGHVYDSPTSFVAPNGLADDLFVACLRSFSADTEVLMADGTTASISNIEVGDEVWSTDPVTGEARNRMVTAVWPHQDTLLEFTVEGGSVTTTEDHHFWNVTDSEWQETQHIDHGDHLLTADGHVVEAGNLDWSTAHDADAYDLTIEGVHTYFVGVGDENVLVHNCNEMLGARGTQVTSQTLTNRPGYRIDVENPAPGVRPGQLHLQTDSSKFLYDFETEQFVGISRSLQRTIDRDPAVQRAIATGRRYLGLDQ